VRTPKRVYDYWLGGKDNFAADRVRGSRISANGVHRLGTQGQAERRSGAGPPR
jgi:hypothetical protein